MKLLVQVTNFPSRDIIDGGTHRENALADFLESQGSVRMVVQNDSWSSISAKLRRPVELVKQISRLHPEMVVLSYPSYPFYWRHKVTPYFLLSLGFASLLRKQADKQKFKIIIDVMDLPVFQYQDLGFDIQIRPETLKRFDRFIFNHADYLWVCSKSMTDLINRDYGIDKSKLIVALNGHDMGDVPEAPSKREKFKFAYGGSMNRERGIGAAIEAFLASGVDAEFHLCGQQGEWINSEYSDSRLIYHGSLTNQQAMNALSSCDVGVIPYPEKGYYHLAFATKTSFYLSLGLPILCSDVAETGQYILRHNVGMVCPMARFSEGFASIVSNPSKMMEWRGKVVDVRNEYSWTSIYSNALKSVREASISSERCGVK